MNVFKIVFLILIEDYFEDILIHILLGRFKNEKKTFNDKNEKMALQIISFFTKDKSYSLKSIEKF